MNALLLALLLSASPASYLKTCTFMRQQAGRGVHIVNEAYTTRACSNCGCLSGPTGLDMLAVRGWQCSECGTGHDRDINAARNIAKLAPRQPASVSGNKHKVNA